MQSHNFRLFSQGKSSINKDEIPYLQSSVSVRVESLFESVQHSVIRLRQWLLDQQQEDGAWRLSSLANLNELADLYLIQLLLNTEYDPIQDVIKKLLWKHQQETVGFQSLNGNDFDLNLAVKSYFILKSVGCDMTHPCLINCRKRIHAHGGITKTTGITRVILYLLGQIPKEHFLEQNQNSKPEPNLISDFQWLEFIARSFSSSKSTEITSVQELFVIEDRNTQFTQNKPAFWKRFSSERANKKQSDSLIHSLEIGSSQYKTTEVLSRVIVTLVSLQEIQHTDLLTQFYTNLRDCFQHESYQVSVYSEGRATTDTLASIQIALMSYLNHSHQSLHAGVEYLSKNQTGESNLLDQLSYAHLLQQIDSCNSETPLPSLSIIRDSEDEEYHHLQIYAEDDFSSDLDAQSEEKTSISEVIEQIYACQNQTGGWSQSLACPGNHLIEHHSSQDDILVSLKIVGKLLDLDSQSVQHKQFKKACNWLMKLQESDGSFRTLELTAHAVIFFTNLLGKLTSGSEIQKVDKIVAAAINWLLVQQDEKGLWTQKDSSEGDQTALVLQALITAKHWDHPVSLRAMQTLLEKSEENDALQSWETFDVNAKMSSEHYQELITKALWLDQYSQFSQQEPKLNLVSLDS